MELEADEAENACETDTLVTYNPDLLSREESLEKASEASTLLAEMAEKSVSQPEETESRPRHPHPYHLKNKYTFRSDSVYSDVIPMSAAPHHSSNYKASDSREKSGSLSSLKAKESKWATLKKKLGKLNSHSNSHTHQHSHGSDKRVQEKERPPANKSLHERRGLFQRAKTLAILPVNKTSKDREETQTPKRVAEPPELFNVGGEMNLIPLELLINVNDLHIRK